ncbi:hypothetical protein [Paraburkholderia sp. Clong3]|uniref:hypothetical protein n=1 Tax=Paraburkholderia sp. Clong3 TaxID=2991061 RepID=UPI00181EE02E|nr:hypothetical protein [Paraburkholderia sp. Cpub6]
MNYETLRRYVDWVYQVQGGKENISIVVRDRDRAMIKRVGLDQLHQILSRTPPPHPPQQPGGNSSKRAKRWSK